MDESSGWSARNFSHRAGQLRREHRAETE